MSTRDQVVLSLLLVFAFSSDAHAYLDPGTGSLIVQGFIAAVGAILLASKVYWARIKSLFDRTNAGDVESGEPSTVQRRQSSSE